MQAYAQQLAMREVEDQARRQRVFAMHIVARRSFAGGRGVYFWRADFGAWHVILPLGV